MRGKKNHKRLVLTRHNILIGLLGLCQIFSSCHKKEVGPQGNRDEELPEKFENGIFILNEGRFGTNNASISFYDPASRATSNGVFRAANDNSLGDIAQSMSIYDNKAYVVINNSKKVEVVDLTNFKSVASITGMSSPRYILPLSDRKAYVTNLKLDNGINPIYVIDLDSNHVSGTIPVTGWTESIIQIDNKVFVSNMRANKIHVIDPATDLIEKEIDVNIEPQSMVVDKDGYLWVLCTGGFEEGKAALIQIHPKELRILKRIEAKSLLDYPANLNINSSGDTLYFLSNGLRKMGIYETFMPEETFIDLSSFQYPYSMAIDPVSNDIYVTEALDFQQDGLVIRYSVSGKRIDEFKVGEGPSEVVFNYE